MLGMMSLWIVVDGLEARASEMDARRLSKGETEGKGLGEMDMWLTTAIAGTVKRFARSKVWQNALASCCDEALVVTVGGARSRTTVEEAIRICFPTRYCIIETT